MSDHDIDVESMLADILGDKDPDDLDTLQDEAPDEKLLSPEADTPAPQQEDDSEAQERSIPTLEDILNEPEEEECSDQSESASETGTAEAVSEILDAGDDNPEQVDGNTTTDTTELHACKSEDEEVAELPEIDESEWSKEVEIESIQLPEFTSDEMMEELDIRNYGTLVSLNTLRWHAKVRDHKAAEDAAAQTGADKAAFEARKRLLVGADEKLKRVHTAIDAARTEHYKMTLPWSTIGVNDHGKRSGPRLLPNTLFFDYTQKMAKYKNDMDDALDEFVTAYPSLIAIAQQKLGGSFDRSQYPPPSTIRQHFGLSFDFLPIPTGADFDNVSLQQSEKLAMAVNKKTKQMLENAMQDAWVRLKDDMEHAFNSLNNPNAKFHYTLIEKMKEHSSMLSHLNVTKDKRIEAIRTRIDKDLAKRDVKDVRKDDALRKHLAGEAKAVLDMMEAYTNGS